MDTPAGSPARARDHDVDRLLLRVAQRADQLARISPSGGSPIRDRRTWDLAERECVQELLAPARKRKRA